MFLGDLRNREALPEGGRETGRMEPVVLQALVFLFTCVCAHYVHLSAVPAGTRRGHQIHQSCSWHCELPGVGPGKEQRTRITSEPAKHITV